MTTLENFVSPALTRALGWTLLHSLWQGALVAAVLAGALLLLRRQRAEVRYVAAAGALGAVVALAGITFGLYFNAGASTNAILGPSSSKTVQAAPVGNPISLARASADLRAAKDTRPAAAAGAKTQLTNQTGTAPAAGEAVAVRPSAPGWLVTYLRYFDNHLPLLVLLWLLGLLAMSLRMLGGLLYVQRLRRYRVRPLRPMWQERLAALAQRSGVRRPVALLESALVQVPLVVGHLRPVILLPLGAVAGLSPAYLEAILAHELAHVLRRDYLVNLLQTVAEVLFFYHPAVWFVANCVRTERENCCDDTATALCGGDSLRLARALTALAEWSQSAVVPATPGLALAAMGGRGALLCRVRRLVQRRPAAPTLAESFMAGALMLGGLGLLGSSVALAGPLTQPLSAASKPAAFDWKASPMQNKPRAAGEVDTTKRVKGTATTTTTSSSTGSGAADAGTVRREVTVVQDGAGAEEQWIEQDTLLRRRAGPRSARIRENRRVVIQGRDMAPPAFPGNAGTVVITKDKKGRLTDLVVNGQRVETETGKRKLKIKDKRSKGDQDQHVEVIRVVPPGAPEARGFVFRYDGGNVQFERQGPSNFRYRTMPPQLEQRIYRDQSPDPGQLEELTGLNRTLRVIRPRAQSLTSDLRAQREALRTAESALRKASAAKNLSAEERKGISKSLADVRAQLKATEHTAAASHMLRLNGDEMQELGPQMRGNVETLRLRQEGPQVRQELEVREERREQLRERIRESERELREIDGSRAGRPRANEEAIVAELLKDGLIKDRSNYQVQLTARNLLVDGKEQPKKVFEKYLKLYETKSGRKLGANGSVMMERNSDTDGDGGPRPPRPPRAPRAPRGPFGVMPPMPPMPPMAPPAPPMTPPSPPMAPPVAPPLPLQAPAPPRPPRAPSVDTQVLRNELRKDGVIGLDEKSFQMQLNAVGLTVNGKRQSDELAAKYRKLVGQDEGPGKVHNLNISTQE